MHRLNIFLSHTSHSAERALLILLVLTLTLIKGREVRKKKMFGTSFGCLIFVIKSYGFVYICSPLLGMLAHELSGSAATTLNIKMIRSC